MEVSERGEKLMYIPEHFTIQEMVPPTLYKQIAHRGASWAWTTLFDRRLLMTMDYLRNEFGPMDVNTWHFGGGLMFRGFRPDMCKVGASLSQHRFGRGVDMFPLDTEVEVVRRAILSNPGSPRYQYIGAIETGIPWLHVDTRERLVSNQIMTFKP